MVGTNSPYFWIDPIVGISKTYDDLINDIVALKKVHKYIKSKNSYELYVSLLAGMLTSEEFTLLDSDWSDEELMNLGITNDKLGEFVYLPPHSYSSIDELLHAISTVKSWKLGFYTSGTTGRPKYIAHNMTVLARNVKRGDKFTNNIWGFCYNPTHFAGIQVFLQALYNKNTMINLFFSDYALAELSIKKYSITHISATPTYYRSLSSYLHDIYPLVERITFGGEMFDALIAERLKPLFPNAKITNVYASTELGSVLAGKGDSLKIPTEFKDKIRISPDGELEVHKSLIGEDSDTWFFTGDMVAQKEDGTIQFLSRKSEMINVGGYKVNPHEVEEIISELPEIDDVIVYGRDNRITGKIIVADVKPSNISCEDIETLIQKHAELKLQSWKIPRMIKIVSEIDRTRTGKKVRK